MKIPSETRTRALRLLLGRQLEGLGYRWECIALG
jgi:hypothetical protein